MTPIFKGGDRILVSNYRLITKQNLMPKILENIVASKLLALFKNIIIEHEFVTVALYQLIYSCITIL